MGARDLPLTDIGAELDRRFGAAALQRQATGDGIPTFWCAAERLPAVLRHLKTEVPQPYRMLYDLTAIDERERVHRDGQPNGDFTLVYHLTVVRPQPGPAPEGGARRRARDDAQHHAAVAGRELVRARSLGHVRHPLRRPPAPAPPADAADLGRPSAAQGASGAGDRDGAISVAGGQGDRRAGGAALRPRGLGNAEAAATIRSSCSSTSGRTIPACTACSGSCCSSTASRSSMRCPTSASIIAARRRWASASRGTASFRTPTASTISAG